MSQAYFMKTTEGTELKDLIKMPKGTIGTFILEAEDRNRFQSIVYSYAKRSTKGRKQRDIVIKSYPVVFDNFKEVKHIHLVEILE